MFCPKCALQNADETKFCRGCGANLSNVLAVVDGKQQSEPPLSEKYIELNSKGVRGLMIGVGFLIVSGTAFSMSSMFYVIGLFSLAFAFVFLGTGIARLIQAKQIKTFRKRDDPVALTPGQSEYIKPSRALFETDDLSPQPLSITEHTTAHLQMDPDDETMNSPKK